MFRFHLQSVLQHRRRRCEACERVVGRATAELVAAQAELQRLQEEHTAAEQTLVHCLAGGTVMRNVQLHQTYREALDGRIAAQHRRLAECEERLAAARQAYLQAETARQALETLYERRWRAYRREQRRAEQLGFDERAMRDVARRLSRDRGTSGGSA
ncbi:MAG: flagellar export protein FliJ [Candidatus Tectomicrobia bacterium]|nr:flagellar export protein FliJ [Candidatus Tectomicrobia bacterium]